MDGSVNQFPEQEARDNIDNQLTACDKIDRIIMKLRENKPVLEEKYKVKTLGVFGSYVRGEQKKSSDLDILVEFQEPVGLFKFMELEEFLEKKIGVKIDLVSKKALKPRIGKHILEEVINV